MPIFEDVLARCAGLSETRLSEPCRGPGQDGVELEVRDALLRSLDLELAAAPPREAVVPCAAGVKADQIGEHHAGFHLRPSPWPLG